MLNCPYIVIHWRRLLLCGQRKCRPIRCTEWMHVISVQPIWHVVSYFFLPNKLRGVFGITNKCALSVIKLKIIYYFLVGIMVSYGGRIWRTFTVSKLSGTAFCGDILFGKGLITFVYYQQQPVGLWIILQSPTIPLKVRTRKTRSRAF